MEIDLKKIRVSKGIPAKDMVAVVKELYSSYDKTLQSKCENGDTYGVCLRQDAAKAICRAFAPELQQKRKKDGHRLTCRISCRLETADYEALMQNIAADGYTTTQDWLADVVKRYNTKKLKSERRT